MECYQLHYARLVRALVLAGAPAPVAEDLAQDAFARMLTHWRRVRTGSSPAGYAYRTAFRLLLRSRTTHRTDLGGLGDGRTQKTAGPGVPGPEGVVSTRMASIAAMAAMPTRRRACAVMCLVVGLSTREAAASLGIAEGTVRKHLAEAREELRHLLTP